MFLINKLDHECCPQSILIDRILKTAYFLAAAVSFFALTRRLPFTFVTAFLIPSSGVFLLIGLLRIRRVEPDFIVFIVFAALLTCHLLYSVFLENTDAMLAIRFYLLLITINLVFFIPSHSYIYKVGYFFLFLQGLLVIVISLGYSFGNNEIMLLVNNAFLREYALGSIFSSFTNIFFVQIMGNPLIPLVAFIYFSNFCKTRKSVLSLAFWICALFLSGQFAFSISFILLAAILLLIIPIDNFKLLGLLSLVTILLAISPFIIDRLEGKGGSLEVRLKDFKVLTDDLSQDTRSIVFGRGLGNWFRYAGESYKRKYYEIQQVFILNQTGVLLFSLFWVTNFYLAVKKMRKKTLICYFMYILYASSNPYIFDLTHFWAIMLLRSSDIYYADLQYNELQNIKRKI